MRVEELMVRGMRTINCLQLCHLTVMIKTTMQESIKEMHWKMTNQEFIKMVIFV